MALFMNKRVERASFGAVAMCLVMALLPACENKPVVNEAMDEDGKPAVQEDAVKTTNIETEGDNMPGMPADTEDVLPGAAGEGAPE